jgi:hypothetical protein
MTALFTHLSEDVIWESVESMESVSTAIDQQVHVTHKGMIKVHDFEIQCYRCSNGEVAFDIEDLDRFMRGCQLCDHPSECPECNPCPEERDRLRVGLILDDE